MAKRTIEDSKSEDSEIDFKYDDEENQLRKKIKLENEKIVKKIKEIDQHIDISEHEVHKFLLIFHTLIETVNSEQDQEETEGVVTDAILQIVIKISELLKKNIDSLNLPTVLKNALKKIKKACLFHKQKSRRKNRMPRRPVRPAGREEKNNDRVRIRNRCYKIKRILAQPRNIDVRHNGRVVRRMVVRRSTIYPSTRRR